MLTEHDMREVEEIRAQTLITMKSVIGDAKDVAIIDAPNQRNIGDSLIWEGELAYLRELNVRIRYVADIKGYDPRDVRRRLPKDGVVLLHGGGNFGDLWEGHQRLRERVVQDLTEYKIVQLPQSIFFSTPERAAEANELLSHHDNFVTLIRDRYSIARAVEQLPSLDIEFCPDMALGYSPIGKNRGKEKSDLAEILVIARADHESASGLNNVEIDWVPGHSVQKTDWAEVAGKSIAWRWARQVTWVDWQIKRARKKIGLPLPVLPNAVVLNALKTINRENVEDAIRLYVGRDVILVDRLHAHVLASLMGINNVLLDNNYKKLGGVFEAYTGNLSTAEYSLSIKEAFETVTRLIKS